MAVEGGSRGMVDEGGTCLLLAPSPGAIVTIRGNIGKSIWLPLPSSLPSHPVLHPLAHPSPLSLSLSLHSLPLPPFCFSRLLSVYHPSTLLPSLSLALPRSARTGEPIMRGCYSGPIPNHPERETGEARVREGRMCVARATGWVA